MNRFYTASPSTNSIESRQHYANAFKNDVIEKKRIPNKKMPLWVYFFFSFESSLSQTSFDILPILQPIDWNTNINILNVVQKTKFCETKIRFFASIKMIAKNNLGQWIVRQIDFVPENRLHYICVEIRKKTHKAATSKRKR